MATVLFTISVCLPLAVQDDRATILEGVESWYQVVQDGKNKGYAHEKLERVKDTWKYTYRADFEIAAKRDWHLEYRDVEATLDEEMAVASLDATLEAAGAVTRFTLIMDGEKRTLLLPEQATQDRLRHFLCDVEEAFILLGASFPLRRCSEKSFTLCLSEAD